MNKSIYGLSEENIVAFEDSKIHHAIIDDYKSLRSLAQEQGIHLKIISGHRDFQRQKMIWNKKVTCHDPAQITHCMRWSAIPGFSRHHWGTDLDVIDARELSNNPDYQVMLEPHEYENQGIFSKLGRFLHEHIKKDSPFFRPYAQDLGGVAPEPWHLSHRLVSQQFMNELNQKEGLQFLQSKWCDDLNGKNYLIENFEQLFQKYVINVDQ